MISPELQSRLAIWRAKAADGTITLEEMRQVVAELRGARLSAGQAPAKAAKAKPDAKSLIDQLKGL